MKKLTLNDLHVNSFKTSNHIFGGNPMDGTDAESNCGGECTNFMGTDAKSNCGGEFKCKVDDNVR